MYSPLTQLSQLMAIPSHVQTFWRRLPTLYKLKLWSPMELSRDQLISKLRKSLLRSSHRTNLRNLSRMKTINRQRWLAFISGSVSSLSRLGIWRMARALVISPCKAQVATQATSMDCLCLSARKKRQEMQRAPSKSTRKVSGSGAETPQAHALKKSMQSWARWVTLHFALMSIWATGAPYPTTSMTCKRCVKENQVSL